MSTLIINMEEVKDLAPLENSDNLLIAKIKGWEVVVRKGQYALGDRVIFLPPDSVLSEEFESKLFPPDSKIKLHNRRVRAIKIRGKISAGLLVNPKEHDLNYVIANVSKYEPPVKDLPKHMQIKKKNKPDIKAFIKYTDIENFKHYDRIFQDGEEVYISSKLHGSSARFGWFRSEANTWWQKLFKALHLFPEWTFAWGSRNVQIQSKLLKRHQGFKSKEQGVDFGDIYTKMVEQYDLKNRIPHGYAVYGEIVGSGIQDNYLYGCKSGEHKLFVYDIYDVENKKWLDYLEFKKVVKALKLTSVPEMYVGSYSREKAESYLTTNTLGKEVNEGVVVKPVKERLSPTIGRVVLKMINPEYYLVNTTENH